MKKIYVWAVAAHGEGISGSDRIFIELTRRWSVSTQITLFLWKEGIEMISRQGLRSKQVNNIFVSEVKIFKLIENIFILNYIFRIISSVWSAIFIEVENPKDTVLYSASEFWMDSLPCFVLKLRYPHIKWVATWYQTAPNPLHGYREASSRINFQLSAFLYWLMQLPIKPIISSYSDMVIVNNDSERKVFPRHSKIKKIFVMIGAIPLADINNYIKSTKTRNRHKYDAVFQGRFHPQKGVLELIDIWKEVVSKLPNAKLALVGDGPLFLEVSKKIKEYDLGENIKLYGYMVDGRAKYQIFSQSKVVLHPSLYDSGGMASAEAMAFGNPAVGYNLKAYESYYPKGMVKVPIQNSKLFAEAIINLLLNEKTRRKIGKEGQEMINKNWSWDVRAKQTLDFILN